MPSERPGRLDWLWSQGLGVLCGQGAVLLLAVGSVVLARTRDGASAGVQGDDITVFFTDPHPAHTWLYLLLGVLALYGLNTALCTLRSVLRKWRAGLRSLGAYGAAMMHVGFVVGLIAHFVGGLGGAERGAVRLGGEWADLPADWPGMQARVAELSTDPHPDGSPKRVRAAVQVRDGQGERTARIAYNEPLSRRLGSELLLLRDQGVVERAIVSDGTGTCRVVQGGLCRLPSATLVADQLLAAGGHWGPDPVLIARTADGAQVFLRQGRAQTMGTGPAITLREIVQEPQLVLRGRHSPGSPLMLLSVGLMCLGMGMLGRRWLPRGPARQ